MSVSDDVEVWDTRHGSRVQWKSPYDPPKVMSRFNRGTLWKVQSAETKWVIESTWESGKRIDSRALPPTVEKLRRDPIRER